VKVLLVEDEFIISMLTEDMLGELGHEVSVSASTLEQGMRFANDGAFDLAVLDINLHGVMSYPIADLLIKRSIPFIFASGYTAQGIDPRYPDVQKLQKPFTLAGLEAVLASAVEGRAWA
jgi:CheY-like chemotaxis protein